MKAPQSDPWFAEHPVHGSQAQARLIRSVLQRVPVSRRFQAIDVGAHIGVWTVPLAGVFRYVTAFEPVASNFECLEVNTRGLKNVSLRPVALGNETRRVSMAQIGDNSGTYCALRGDDVGMMTLDVLMADRVSVDFIKLDVEGMEGAVLEGARQVLDEWRPWVFFEDNGLGTIHYGPDWIDPKSILRGLGYHPVVRLAKNELWQC